MKTAHAARLVIAGVLCGGLAACGGGGPNAGPQESADMRPEVRRTTIWDVFEGSENPNTTVGVNKYLWNASLEVLNFLPVQSVDPFTGVIVDRLWHAAGRRPVLSRHDQDRRSGTGRAQPEAVAARPRRRGSRARAPCAPSRTRS